jgi:hypothetical protein
MGRRWVAGDQRHIDAGNRPVALGPRPPPSGQTPAPFDEMRFADFSGNYVSFSAGVAVAGGGSVASLMEAIRAAS